MLPRVQGVVTIPFRAPVCKIRRISSSIDRGNDRHNAAYLHRRIRKNSTVNFNCSPFESYRSRGKKWRGPFTKRDVRTSAVKSDLGLKLTPGERTGLRKADSRISGSRDSQLSSNIVPAGPTSQIPSPVIALIWSRKRSGREKTNFSL